jgi:hypothetical protein
MGSITIWDEENTLLRNVGGPKRSSTSVIPEDVKPQYKHECIFGDCNSEKYLKFFSPRALTFTSTGITME